MKIKTMMRYHLTTVRMFIIKKTKNDEVSPHNCQNVYHQKDKNK